MDDLTKMRIDIDSLDQELMTLLEKRYKLSKEIGLYKKDNNIQVLDLKREHVILDKARSYSEEIYNVFFKIIEESKKLQ
jgi:chorismate mutase